MRIEFILCVAMIFAMNLGGCSQPEPVISSYAPQDCSCEEDEREEAGKGEASKNEESLGRKAVEKGDPSVPESLRLTADMPEEVEGESVEIEAAKTLEKPLKTAPKSALTRANCEAFLARDDGEAKGKTEEIAKVEAKPEVPASSAAAPLDASRIDLNRATLTELIGLPGVGPALAGRIVDYRQKRRFGKPAHLMRVKGIGKAKYAKVADLVAVGVD